MKKLTFGTPKVTTLVVRSARQESMDSLELEQERSKFVAAVEVTAASQEDIDTFFPPLTPTFVNDVPRVRTDKVIQGKSLPPDSWRLLP